MSYKGGLLDIEKLMNQLKRSEQARFDTEVKLMEIKEENSKILEKQAKYISTTTSLSAELEDTKKKLNETQNGLSRMTVSLSFFFKPNYQQINLIKIFCILDKFQNFS